jgi:hypothetical protein
MIQKRSWDFTASTLSSVNVDPPFRTERTRDSLLRFNFAALPSCHGGVALDAADSSASATDHRGLRLRRVVPAGIADGVRRASAM